jgi:hypothetical protein
VPQAAITDVPTRSDTLSRGGHDGRTSFHPQRLFPRFARPMELASRIPGGLRLASFLTETVAFDEAPSATENPTGQDLASAHVAVCGFPRTGTTFIQGAVNRAMDDDSACWKNHDPLAIPLYATAGIPTMVTLRPPIDTVVSWSLYNHDEPSAELMAWRFATYTAWHREALRATRSPWVTVIDFDAFCADPIALLDDVLGRPHPATVTPAMVTQDVRAGNESSGLALRHGNVPDARRSALRTPFVDLLDDHRVRTALDRAEAAYRRMERLV